MEIDSTGNLYPITQANQFLLLKVSLWNEFGTEEIRRVIKTPKEKNILVGDLIKSPEVLKDEFDREDFIPLQFQVLPPKSFTGSKLSSKLTIKFKEQGVRLIIKKLRVFEVAPENYVPTVIKTDSGWKSHQKDSGINLGEVHN
ncbi:hypothetical protein HK099_004791 [Clydaea vesicula]|uniref:Uncharacterized protein n=1 Tax=Clydaea vesicula TaxID=447962 RepID=A0AAD5Y3E9_9FUNG|nr:hypothetical protein HK099_004791 [Clydaea vesicula]KAJ3396467.1 hypothetical protein HDU92_002878 [Lobulomyces angularis]